MLFAVAMVAVAVAAAVVTMKIVSPTNRPKYVAVYLQTGELYFGSMRWFPTPQLSHVMLLQRTQDQGLTLDRFTNAVWRPKEPMQIRPDKIVFWTYLEPESPIVQALEGRIVPSGGAPSPSPMPSPSPSK
jgi:hypothetical protein